MKVSEIKLKRKGEPVLDLMATIEVVTDPKEGTSEDGKWKLQNVKLSDETGEIWATLSNRETLPKSAKGKVIFLSSVETKHGLKGCLVDEWNNEIKVKITPTCTWVEDPQGNAGMGDSAQAKPVEKLQLHQSPSKDSMWADKERRELRKTIWDTVFMTLFPKTSLVGEDFIKQQDKIKLSLLDLVNQYAESGFKFVYQQDPNPVQPEIEFPGSPADDCVYADKCDL